MFFVSLEITINQTQCLEVSLRLRDRNFFGTRLLMEQDKSTTVLPFMDKLFPEGLCGNNLSPSSVGVCSEQLVEYPTCSQ